jgi:integrase/recombinase XerD
MQKADKLKIKITPVRKNVDWLTEEEVSYVISRIKNPRVRAAIVLMASLGLRREETTTIKLSDMHDTWVHVNGKGCKDRNIPISKDVWAMLEPYMIWRRSIVPLDRDRDTFLLSRNKRRYTPDSLASRIYETMKKFPFHFSAHTFRRTYGRLMYFAGCSLVKLKTWMGHATLEMTIRYLGIEYQDPTDGGQYIPRYAL